MNETSSNHAFNKSMLRKLVLIGMICGVVCSFSKLGWEVPFPPRTPARDETNPPQQLLQQVGFFIRNNTRAVRIYNKNKVAIAPMIMHFGFSFTFSILYVLAVEFFPVFKLWQGAAFGILLWIARSTRSCCRRWAQNRLLGSSPLPSIYQNYSAMRTASGRLS